MGLVCATKNKSKVQEFQKLLPSIDLLPLKNINCFEEIPETSNTIEGNAIQKCKYISDKYNVDCFTDDTGLMVDTLNGSPGVYSARYAGNFAKDEDNIRKLLMELKGATCRTAKFKTVIALSLNKKIHTFEGVCKGQISLNQKGNKGFGYDSIFIPESFNTTFAEMNIEEKNRISHRGKAIKKFLIFLNDLDLF